MNNKEPFVSDSEAIQNNTYHSPITNDTANDGVYASAEIDPIYQHSGMGETAANSGQAQTEHPYFYMPPRQDAPEKPYVGYNDLKSQKKNCKGGKFLKFVAFCMAIAVTFYGSYQLASYQVQERMENQINELKSELKSGLGTPALPLPNVSGKESTGNKTNASSYTASPVVSIAEHVVPAVVTITSTVTATNRNPFFGNQTQTYKESGSGVVYKVEDGNIYIVTNHHVIENGNVIEVSFFTEEKAQAEVIGYDSRNDLAVLKVRLNDLQDKNITVAQFGDSSILKVGQLAVAIGNPLGEGHDHTITAGIISSVNRTLDIENIKDLEVIQTDAAINPGNSGGALVNEFGQVIGINTAKYLDVKVEGMGFAIPSNIALSVIDKIVKNGTGDAAYALSDDRPFLGIGYRNIDSEIYNETGVAFGVYIHKVYEGGAAHAAGIKPGDILFSINGTRIKDANMLFDSIGKLKVGDTIKLGVVRQDKVFEVETVMTSFAEVNQKNNGDLKKQPK